MVCSSIYRWYMYVCNVSKIVVSVHTDSTWMDEFRILIAPKSLIFFEPFRVFFGSRDISWVIIIKHIIKYFASKTNWSSVYHILFQQFKYNMYGISIFLITQTKLLVRICSTGFHWWWSKRKAEAKIEITNHCPFQSRSIHFVFSPFPTSSILISFHFAWSNYVNIFIFLVSLFNFIFN